MITENNTLEMKNVLAYRCKGTQVQVKEKGKELEAFLRDAGAKPTALPVTATFAVETGKDGQLVDMEFLIPLDIDVSNEVEKHNHKLENSSAPYRFIKDFYLTNAVKVRHVGNPMRLQESIAGINKYIMERNYTPITIGYNVTLNQPKTQAELDKMEIDVYVGVSPNRV